MRSKNRADIQQAAEASTRARPVRAGRRRALVLWGTLLGPVTALTPVATLLAPGAGHADPATEARYPFDPACPWGRLANGKGMIARCLGEEEARALLAGGTLTTSGGAKVAIRGIGEGAASAPSTPTPAGAAAPQSAAPSTPSPALDAAASPTPTRPVKVEVGPVIPDEGELSIGQLGKPVDRYRACIEQNGGLQGTSGEVRIHFLVRGERGRAEGVEVAEARGVTKKAAQCLADVVDRRATGTPSQPLVGATLVFKISS
jgi:hypothetical protein